MFDIERSKNRRHANKEYINKMTAGILSYYSDPNKKERLLKGLCRCCYYVNTSRISGSAITTRKCSNCEDEMHFDNTCTDILCLKCSIELKHCKHCSQKLD